MCTYVCASENAKLVSKYALKVSQRICQSFFFFISLCFVISVFILEREQRSKAALQVFAALYAKFTQIAADNANEENGRERLKRVGGEESGAEAAATQIKSNFQFPELAKIEKFTAATRAHTHTNTHTFTFAHTETN